MKKITKEFLEEDINIAEDFPNMELERLFESVELERLLKKEFEDEIENEK